MGGELFARSLGFKGEIEVKRVTQENVEKKKADLIEQLISRGVYKLDGIHLFELGLTDLEVLFHKVEMNQKAQ